MANCCFYEMAVTGRKEDIERLYRIMDYKDPNFYIYRVEELETSLDPEILKDDIYYAQFMGEVAWAAWRWKDTTMRIDGKDTEYHNRRYCSLLFLTELLHLGVEIYAEETDTEFMEHYVFKDGEVLADECRDFCIPYYDVGAVENYCSGTIDEIVEDIKECYGSYVPEDLLDKMLNDARHMLEEHGSLVMYIGGYERCFDPEKIWDGTAGPAVPATYEVDY